MMQNDRPDPEVFARRRARVQHRLGGDSALILTAAPEVVVGRDLDLRYRPDSDLYYLTGCAEPGAIMVLGPDSWDEPFTLFIRPRDPDAERWSGRRIGVEEARSLFSADVVYEIGQLAERVPALIAQAEVLYYPIGGGPDQLEEIVRVALTTARARRQRSGRGLRTLRDPGVLLDDLRLIKDDHELEALASAAAISVQTFLEVAPMIRPGVGEWELEAALDAGFRRRGAAGPAFASIVASGANATVLHYIDNHSIAGDDELLLIDAGARHQEYNGDISRTFPVSGRFSPAQLELYDAVLAAHGRAIAAIRPGTTYEEVHLTAVRTLVDAMVGVGLLDGEPDSLIESGAYRAYFPHQTGHWLGLDVHDVGEYGIAGEPRPLEPGMVLTIEPGLYIPADDQGAHPELRGTGIRIEDDVVVTRDGYEILTTGLPTKAGEIEALLG